LVGTGSNRVFRAEVAISRHPGQTVIDVRPGRLSGTWPGGVKLVDRLWIVRKAHQVLLAAPDLRWVGGHSAVRARRQVPVRSGGS
jgi:hypothetical protein